MEFQFIVCGESVVEFQDIVCGETVVDFHEDPLHLIRESYKKINLS